MRRRRVPSQFTRASRWGHQLLNRSNYPQIERDRGCPADSLARAVLNDDISTISGWIKHFGINHEMSFDTSDLLGWSCLERATPLNVAIHLRKERAATWLIEAGASVNISVWRSSDEYLGGVETLRVVHPLAESLEAGLYQAAKLMLESNHLDLMHALICEEDPNLEVPLWKCIAAISDVEDTLQRLGFDHVFDRVRGFAAPTRASRAYRR